MRSAAEAMASLSAQDVFGALPACYRRSAAHQALPATSTMVALAVPSADRTAAPRPCMKLL
jgi:hypothetical protein